MKHANALPRGDADLGGILRNWREVAGYTQEQVAKMLDMARTSYNALEQGQRAITSNDLRNLASIFEVSVAQLVQPDGLTPPKQASFWEMLIEEARELSIQDRAMLLEFVRFLRSRKE